MNGDGIILVAHGNPTYFGEVEVLAKSLRQSGAPVQLALATDLEVPAQLAALFDVIVKRDFSAMKGLEFKLWLDTFTPFTGRTLFIDADSVCYGDPTELFKRWQECDFVALGTNYPQVNHWFRDCGEIKRERRISSFPFMIGDFYLFRKTPATLALFATARSILQDYDRIGILRLKGILRNEEPVFSLAMAQHGVAAQERTGDAILALEFHTGFRRIGQSIPPSFSLGARTVKPTLVHFGSFRTHPFYASECRRVKSGGKPSMIHTLAGFADSVFLRARKRLRAR